jgi:hypothetical protein
MLRRATAAASIVIATVLVSAPNAAGGGWATLDLRGRHFGPTETIQSGGQALFPSAKEAERARTGIDRYFVYLVPDLDWDMAFSALVRRQPARWWHAPPGAVRIGDVRVRVPGSNLARVLATFEIPDVTPGEYALVVCSEGCAAPLGDLAPSRIIVTGDAVTAATARAMDRLRWRVRRQGHTRRQARSAKRAASVAEAEAAAALERTSELEHELARLRRAPTASNPSSAGAASAGWLVAGIALGAWAGAAFRRRRAARADGQLPPPWVPERATASAPDRAAIPMAWEGERPLASPNVRPAANESPAPYASRVGPGTGVAR